MVNHDIRNERVILLVVALVFLVLVLGNIFGYGYGMNHMIWSPIFNGMFLFMSFIGILVTIALILLIIWLYRQVTRY